MFPVHSAARWHRLGLAASIETAPFVPHLSVLLSGIHSADSPDAWRLRNRAAEVISISGAPRGLCSQVIFKM